MFTIFGLVNLQISCFIGELLAEAQIDKYSREVNLTLLAIERCALNELPHIRTEVIHYCLIIVLLLRQLGTM